jgi:hypothetical protein
MPDTIRMQCLDAIEDALASMEAGEPVDDPYSVRFTQVEDGPLSDADARKRFVAGIVPGRETKRTMFPLDHCILPVAIEFRMTGGVRRSATPAPEPGACLGQGRAPRRGGGGHPRAGGRRGDRPDQADPRAVS